MSTSVRSEDGKPIRVLKGSISFEQDWYAGSDVGHEDMDGASEPFVYAALQSILWMIRGVDNADFRVRDHFQQAMWFLSSLGVAESELAELFGTTANAVNRWANGRSAPTPVMRTSVVRTGLQVLRQRGFKMAGHRYDAVTGTRIE